MNCNPYAPDIDPEISALHSDIAEIAEERDRHAASAQELRKELDAARQREARLERTVTMLNTVLRQSGVHTRLSDSPSTLPG